MQKCLWFTQQKWKQNQMTKSTSTRKEKGLCWSFQILANNHSGRFELGKQC